MPPIHAHRIIIWGILIFLANLTIFQKAASVLHYIAEMKDLKKNHQAPITVLA